MTATITHINTARERREKTRPPSNVIAIQHIAERIRRHRKAMDRLMQDMNIGWHHNCPVAHSSGWLLRDQPCVWCKARDPGAPDDAA